MIIIKTNPIKKTKQIRIGEAESLREQETTPTQPPPPPLRCALNLCRWVLIY